MLLALALILATQLQPATEVDWVAFSVAGKEASFTQRFTPKGFKNAQVESGTVIFGSMPKMRWTYAAPEQKVFVFDGNRSWFYVPADKQVTVGRIDDARKRELPFLMIGDPDARQRAFVISEQRRGSGTVTTFKPKDAGAMIRTVSMTTDARHLIQRIEYTDREGNHTSFDFSGYHPKAATADTFQFTAPAGVQVVGGE